MKSAKRQRLEEEAKAEYVPEVRASEQLLIDVLPELPAGSLICNSVGRGQFALRYAALHPEHSVQCWYLDVFQSQQAAGVPGGTPANLSWVCSPDLPEGPADNVAIAVTFRGEAELKRDLIQQGATRVKPGGQMIAATDGRDDQWLHDELKKLFPKVTRRPYRSGVTYLATKVDEPKKLKSFDCEFAFRDQANIVFLKSRPGVFSHRRLDLGARALINLMATPIEHRVMDLGCGSGGVALAAALRGAKEVIAVDSNPRALQCVEWAAAKAEVSTIRTILDADGTGLPEACVNGVYANPPYFSNYKIAEIFLNNTLKVLEPGGRLHLVTKAPDWFLENMEERFDAIQTQEERGYIVIEGKKPKRRPRPAYIDPTNP